MTNIDLIEPRLGKMSGARFRGDFGQPSFSKRAVAAFRIKGIGQLMKQWRITNVAKRNGVAKQISDKSRPPPQNLKSFRMKQSEGNGFSFRKPAMSSKAKRMYFLRTKRAKDAKRCD